MRATLLLSFLIVCAGPSWAQMNAYEKSWSKVYKHELKDLTQSALDEVDAIYKKAKADKNSFQITKALIYQSKFALTLEEDAELLIVNRFKKEIGESKFPHKNILESMLASLYWQHFQENRWRYYNRSQTDEKVNVSDFRTWDARQILQEIQLLYQQSLLHELQLQQISLKSYDEMLVQAIDSKIYRPTLFDFLAHQALDFLETNEGKTASVFRFKLDDDRYWNDFMNLSLQANDSLSSLMQAMKIYRRLLAFHQNDQDPTAYINLELERLRFLYEQGTYTDVSRLYQNALIQFKTRYAHHPSSTLIDFELASLLFKEGGLYKPKSAIEHQYKKKDACELCDAAIRNFPQGYGAEKCRLLKENIELRKLQLTAERFIPIRKFSRIQVEYTSIDSLTFSAYRVPSSFAQKFYYLKSDSMKLAALAKLHPEASWKVSLIKSQDYQHHVTEVVVPPLPQGQYLVVAHTMNEPSHSTLFGYATIQCTNLAMIESRLDQNQRYQVVDRNSGRPIVGADIHFKSNDTLSGKQRVEEHRTTEKDGFTEIKKKKFFIGDMDATVIYQSDTAHLGEYSFQPIREPEENDNDEFDAKTFLFSDRSIYRPGQTVYFKGILIKIKGKKSTVVAGEYVEVILENTNGEEVEKIRLKTNAYGSFSGEFKLPSTGLTGEYTLYADEDTEEDTRFYDDVVDFDYVNLTISVEEYKRPTFETTFKPTTHTFMLLDTVSVAGSATAYNGSKISGAKVSYRVKRNVRFPRWYYWDNSYSPSDEVEITHGEITTNDDGAFKINFAAIPDEKVSKESRPVFQYEITADVTDVNGETRSATTYVNVGFHSLLITLQGARTIDKRNQYYPIQLSVENLNGQPAYAKGIIRLYKLKYPMAPVRNRPWSEPDLPLLTEREFISLFPNDSYGDVNPLSEHGAKVSELPFNTEVTKNITVAIDPSWPIGSYEMELIAKDNAGNEILEKHRFEVSDSSSKAIADNALLQFETDQSSYRIGDVAKVKVGSASTDITLTLEVEHNDQITRTFVEHFSGNYKEFKIPITESMGEGFRVICGGVNYNSFIQQAKTISIIRDKDKIEIETITFKDKLQPGSKEMWSFEIKGNDAHLKEAEVLASMYDASLDQFKDHKWYFEPQRSQPYYSYYAPTAHQSFGDKNFVIRNQRYGFTSIPDIYYDSFDWFGFTITKNSYVHRKYLERFYSDGVHTGKPSKVSLGHNKTIRKGYIEGTIRAGDGSLMAGVNVVIKGTTIGTMTDEKGNYSMKAGKGDIIVYSFIGYSTAEFTVKSKNVMNVTMEEDVTQLSEVVVTAYGVSVERKSLGFATATVSENSTEGDFTFEQQLQGRVAGVQITNASGGDARLVIRGTNSLQANNEPLYMVDGVFVETGKIDQSDLASIQVLKGSAAVSLYGSRAVNGVFIITTKSGQKKLDEELAKVSVRKELKETAFFFPHLKTDEEGRIQFSFTTPEALTRWKLQLLAHTKDLLTATKTLQTVTQKELMVTPNPPRFLRVGDEIVFATKISNLAGESKSGIASLQLTNALTGAPIDQLVGNNQRNQSFTLTSKGNTQVSWRLKIPQSVDAIQYKVIAKAGNFSDGEQNVLPVLSNRILVTETLPMQIRAGQTKTFSLDKLKEAASPTLQPHQLTLEVTSNPAWYALQSLPYLMEYPHECAEQTFARYYANLLGSHIANSHPKIKHVFDQWTSSDALISNLEKNPELKSILIQETPWIRDAQNESETKKRIGLLFDLSKMKEQLQATTAKLQQMQLPNGGFPWFKGSDYASTSITMHIASGLGHLKKLNIPVGSEFADMLVKVLRYLDQEMSEQYSQLMKQAVPSSNQQVNAFMDRKHIRSYEIQYTYMRSFFPEIKPTERAAEALDYYHQQSKQYWNEFNLYDKAMIALIHFRNGDLTFSQQILKSLTENSIQSDEMGMYWKENKAGWNWNEAPIETQALLIEAFSEIQSADRSLSKEDKKKTLDELRLWLLKNKQTSQWKTTKATTEAIYALLLNGTDWLSLEDQVTCRVGGTKVSMDDSSVEAGSGYFKTSWKKEEIKPSMSEIVISNKGDGVAWGGLYWQYFEEADKITSSESALRISKKVFLVKRTDQGELLTEINDNVSLAVGDLIRVRIELQSDRTMEFLHMNDMRAAGLEPVDVLSEYKWKDGLGYYQSTKDASVNFFFDAVRKGVYVFEYDLRVNNKGNFSNGITTIQSMYAPKFSSHSQGIRITIR